MGGRDPQGQGQVFGVVRSTKALLFAAAVYAAKNNGVSATAAADCIAPDWLVSH